MERGGGNKYSSNVFYKKTDWMPHTGLKCLNATFIMPLICRGGGQYLFIQNKFFGDLHLQIIASISLKASIENSSAQWAIFFFLFYKPWLCPL